MSEENKIPPEEIPQMPPDEMISSAEPVTETEQRETNNEKQETKNMETHANHLHHAPGKKFWHYFYEFLMLFLAVFCGFLAENQREHYVEHQREKKYMTTLLEDLEIDTADMGALKRTLEGVLARKDSITKYLRPPINAEMTPQYYTEAKLILNIRSYSYNDRTVEQLRSSGNYRLIGNKNVTDSLIAYDIRMRGTFSKNYNALYENRIKLIDLQQDIIEVAITFKYVDENRNIRIDSLKKYGLWPLHLLTTDTKTLFHYYNACIAHTGFAIDMNNWINRMTNKATNLIALIKKEYHLE